MHSQAFVKHSMTISSNSLDKGLLFEAELAIDDAMRAGSTLLSTFFDNGLLDEPAFASSGVRDDEAIALWTMI
jgi:hypothetical protein